MEKIENLLKEDEADLRLAGLSIAVSRVKFAKGFDKLCSWLSPTLTVAEMDLRHFGDAMNVSFYDRILREHEKREAAEMEVDVEMEVDPVDEFAPSYMSAVLLPPSTSLFTST